MAVWSRFLVFLLAGEELAASAHSLFASPSFHLTLQRMKTFFKKGNSNYEFDFTIGGGELFLEEICLQKQLLPSILERALVSDWRGISILENG